MSDGSAPHGGSVGASVDRPARIQELRTAAGADEPVAMAATATALHERPEPAPRGGAPVAPAPTAPGASPRRGRGPVVAAVVVVVLLVALATAFVVGRSGSTGDASASAPTTSAPRVVVAPDVVAEEQRTQAMCEAFEVYAIDDLLRLGDNVVTDPDGFLAAYQTLAVNAPGELFALIDQMGPLTRKVVAAVKAGELTTTTEVQAWLVAEPPAELEAWVGPQQRLAPEISVRCG